jgi:hypothetical protein
VRGLVTVASEVTWKYVVHDHLAVTLVPYSCGCDIDRNLLDAVTGLVTVVSEVTWNYEVHNHVAVTLVHTHVAVT